MSLNDILVQVKSKLDDTKKVGVYSLFAYNTTGKTRLSKLFKENYDNETLCYNSFFEDLFTWDNENFLFKMKGSSDLAKLIQNEGLENEISTYFKKLINSKLEPAFITKDEYIEISFNYFTGDNKENLGNIKISRAEENIFI